MSDVVLFDYWRSTASYRVRIALNLAGIAYKSVPVDLVAGDQRSAEYLDRNAQGFVPVLEIDDIRLTQSLSILEYLNETRQLGLLPKNPVERARVRALAQIIACDIHPVCNVSVVAFAAKNATKPEAAKLAWMQHFIRRGLVAFEQQVSTSGALPFEPGMKPSLADICLIPQLYNAKRWSVEYDDLSSICAIETARADNIAFIDAAPAKP